MNSVKFILKSTAVLRGLIAAFHSASAQTWMLTSAPDTNWFSVASSADGSKLAAVVNGGGIWTSTDSGNTWTSNNAPNLAWTSVASSADGSKLVAVVFNGIIGGSNGGIFTSTNSGNSWTSNNVPIVEWTSVASSADGNKLVAVAPSFGVVFNPEYPDYIYISTNSGSTWTSKNVVPYQRWASVASSADGSKLVAAVAGGGIWTSTDSGDTWTLNFHTNRNFYSVASSADGSKVVAVDSEKFGILELGRIWTSQTTISPVINITPSSNNFTLSWIVPSTNFVLQQNLDLTTTNWVTMTNTPSLNLTNLQDEVVLSPSNSSGFYRLATP